MLKGRSSVDTCGYVPLLKAYWFLNGLACRLSICVLECVSDTCLSVCLSAFWGVCVCMRMIVCVCVGAPVCSGDCVCMCEWASDRNLL